MVKKSYMKKLLIILTFISSKALAQSDETAIKTVINNLFDGMRKTDTAMIRASFAKEPIIQTIVGNKEGKTVVLTEPLDSFIVFVSKPHSEIYDERIVFDLIKVDGDLAIAWTPYKFYIGEKFSHCGVDSYQLVKHNSEWKIQYLIDTRRKEKCEWVI